MEVHREVQSVVGFQAVVVAVGEVAELACVVVGCVGLVLVVVGIEGTAVARGIYPGGREVEALAKLIVGCDVDVVAAVILGMKGASTIYYMSLAVELTHCLGPRVGHPTGKVADGALCHQLQSVGPSAAHSHLVFPLGRTRHEGASLAVLEQIVHVLVVTLHGEVAQSLQLIVGTGSHLVGMLGHDALGRGHPQVGGQTDAAVRQHVHILRHIGISRFEREVVCE